MFTNRLIYAKICSHHNELRNGRYRKTEKVIQSAIKSSRKEFELMKLKKYLNYLKIPLRYVLLMTLRNDVK